MNPKLPIPRYRSLLAGFCFVLLAAAAYPQPALKNLTFTTDGAKQGADGWYDHTAGTVNTTAATMGTSGDRDTYLRFKVTGVTGKIAAIKLRLWKTVNTAGSTVTTIYAANNSGGSAINGLWTMTTVAGRPWRCDTPFFSGPAPTNDANSFDEFDLTSDASGYTKHDYVSGDGFYTMVISNSRWRTYASSEDANSAHWPQLVITYADDSDLANPPQPSDATYESFALNDSGAMMGDVYALAADQSSTPATASFLQYGYIDVTKQPYGAVGTDTDDDRLAIQRAINDALRTRAVVYLPSGTYYTSDTIELVQGCISPSAGLLIYPSRDLYGVASTPANDGDMEKWFNPREFGNALVGASKGGRSIIKLMAHTNTTSPSFNNKSIPRPVLRIWSRGNIDKYALDYDPVTGSKNFPTVNRLAVNYNQTVTNIDIDLNAVSSSNYNGGAIGMTLGLAQGGVISKCKITATGGYAGFYGLGGPGGGIYDCTVDGGDYGARVVDGNGGQTPLVSGCIFKNQLTKAIYWHGLCGITLVGTNISGQGIHVEDIDYGTLNDRPSPWNGMLCLIDSQIKLASPGPAIVSSRPVYMNRVHVFNGHPAINVKVGTSTDIAAKEALLTYDNGWIKIPEFAGSPLAYDQCPNKYEYPATGPASVVPYYIGGAAYQTDTLVSGVARLAANLTAPDYQPKHALPAIPSFFDDQAAFKNVKTDFPGHAPAGDGLTDDTDELQYAIDNAAGKALFLPKGDYRISKTLKLKNGTRLVGVHKNHTTIQSMYAQLAGSDFDFGSSSAPKPLIETPAAGSANANCQLSNLTLTQRVTDAGSYLLHWQSGGPDSAVVDVTFLRRPMGAGGALNGVDPSNQPMLLIEGPNAGGRFFSIWAVGNEVVPNSNFSTVKIDGTSNGESRQNQPLAFYMLNCEYAHATAGLVNIANARDINVYQSKFEGNFRSYEISGCENIRIFGLGGNACPFPSDIATYVPSGSDYASWGQYNENVHISGSSKYLVAGASFQLRVLASPYETDDPNYDPNYPRFEGEKVGVGSPADIAAAKVANEDDYDSSVGAITNPTKYNRLREEFGLQDNRTPGTEQFTLFKRGVPTPTIADIPPS